MNIKELLKGLSLIKRSLHREIRYLRNQGSPVVEVPGSMFAAEYNPMRFSEQSGEIFDIWRMVERLIGRNIVYYPILPLALEDQDSYLELIKYGKEVVVNEASVDKNESTYKPHMFEAHKAFQFVDQDGRITMILPGDIVISKPYNMTLDVVLERYSQEP